jgi:hypothetical protein
LFYEVKSLCWLGTFQKMLLAKSARGVKHERTKGRKGEKGKKAFRASGPEFANGVHVWGGFSEYAFSKSR